MLDGIGDLVNAGLQVHQRASGADVDHALRQRAIRQAAGQVLHAGHVGLQQVAGLAQILGLGLDLDTAQDARRALHRGIGEIQADQNG